MDNSIKTWFEIFLSLKEIPVELYFILYGKNNSRWIKDLSDKKLKALSR